MRTIVFRYTAAGSQQLILDKSTRLKGSRSTGNGIVSQDPNLVTTDVTLPAVSDQRTDILDFSSNIASMTKDIPLRVGLTYFVAHSGQGFVMLYLDP